MDTPADQVQPTNPEPVDTRKKYRNPYGSDRKERQALAAAAKPIQGTAIQQGHKSRAHRRWEVKRLVKQMAKDRELERVKSSRAAGRSQRCEPQTSSQSETVRPGTP